MSEGTPIYDTWTGRIVAYYQGGEDGKDILPIVKALAEKSPYPPAEGQIYYIRCFYCGIIEGEGHKEDCLWLRARNIMGME